MWKFHLLLLLDTDLLYFVNIFLFTRRKAWWPSGNTDSQNRWINPIKISCLFSISPEYSQQWKIRLCSNKRRKKKEKMHFLFSLKRSLKKNCLQYERYLLRPFEGVQPQYVINNLCDFIFVDNFQNSSQHIQRQKHNVSIWEQTFKKQYLFKFIPLSFAINYRGSSIKVIRLHSLIHIIRSVPQMQN